MLAIFALTLVPAACPVLCSGNGQYSRGRCLCYSGWKGTECDVPNNQCIDIHCGGHGICIMGACVCNAGYKGENCEEGKYLFQIIMMTKISSIHFLSDIISPYFPDCVLGRHIFLLLFNLRQKETFWGRGFSC